MWVARDKSGILWLFTKKPQRENKGGGFWTVEHIVYYGIEIFPSLFPDLKWEDEPIEVGLYDDTLFKFISELITEYDDNVHPRYDYIKERFLEYMSNEQSKSA